MESGYTVCPVIARRTLTGPGRWLDTPVRTLPWELVRLHNVGRRRRVVFRVALARAGESQLTRGSQCDVRSCVG